MVYYMMVAETGTEVAQFNLAYLCEEDHVSQERTAVVLSKAPFVAVFKRLILRTLVGYVRNALDHITRMISSLNHHVQESTRPVQREHALAKSMLLLT